MSLFPTTSQWRKEGGQDVCLSVSSDVLSILIGGELFIEHRWNISPISHTAITRYYVTADKRIIRMESNCCCGPLHFVDGDFQRVMFPPISQPPLSQ